MLCVPTHVCMYYLCVCVWGGEVVHERERFRRSILQSHMHEAAKEQYVECLGSSTNIYCPGKKHSGRNRGRLEYSD